MIITRLIGGLGNQLFQYATARRLAHLHDVPLKIDTSGFIDYTLHKYSLHPFNIIEDIASAYDLYLIKKPYRKRLNQPFKFLKYAILRKNQITPIIDQTMGFYPEILSLPDNVYLDGYWQSEKYFKDIDQIIRTDFSIKRLPDKLNIKIGEQIADSESVSIHIRRGDYVNNPQTNQIHGVCSLEYYQKAISEMLMRIDRPKFYVFSDAPAWAKANISVESPIVFLTHNDASKNYEDLRLMSMCNHHIIANSSFSWWGAWLSKNSEKIVVAPKKWFASEPLNVLTEDLIPSSWELI